MIKHVYKVGMGSAVRLIEASSAAAAAIFYGVNLVNTNNPFATVCYEEDGQPWQGDSFWFSLVPTETQVHKVFGQISSDDVAACRVVNEPAWLAGMACIHVAPDEPACDECLARLGMTPDGVISSDTEPVTLDLLIRSLAQANADAKAAQDAYNAVYTQFLTENDRIIRWRDETARRAKQIDEEVRQAARDDFAETGDFQPHPAVTFRKMSKVVYDESTAIAWAQEMGRADLLNINKKEFERAVKDGNVPDDVAKVVIDPTPAISTKLGEYLPVDRE